MHVTRVSLVKSRSFSLRAFHMCSCKSCMARLWKHLLCAELAPRYSLSRGFHHTHMFTQSLASLLAGDLSSRRLPSHISRPYVVISDMCETLFRVPLISWSCYASIRVIRSVAADAAGAREDAASLGGGSYLGATQLSASPGSAFALLEFSPVCSRMGSGSNRLAYLRPARAALQGRGVGGAPGFRRGW